MAELKVKGRLGERLIAQGRLTPEELQVALDEQKRFHRPLGMILSSLGFATQEDVARLVAEDHGLPFLSAADIEPDPLILSGLDPAFVRESQTFPYALADGVLRVLTADPDSPERVSHLRHRFPYPLEIAITTEDELHKLIRFHLQARTSRVAEILSGLQGMDAEDPGSFPVESVTEAILLDGIHRHATDIHVEPEELVTRVRYRVDGILHGGENLAAWVTPAVVSRIKILARLDISERRRPQDGRLRMDVDERTIDMRVSVMPTNYGENVVLRILDSSASTLRLSHLGLSPADQNVLQRVSQRPHGLFLVTGPTGSGKTTTLYAMLSQIDAMRQKVATVEDPIEYRLPLLRQSQVDPSIGFTFNTGLRALLRQDPDVILVGEIRDEETADMAIKASMTGHLVLSTLHTNSAVGAVARLVDMGIEPYLVEDCLIGAMSQRLMRRTCQGCVEEVVATPADCEWLGVEQALLRRGRGCDRCDSTGYQGRIAAIELFLPDATIAMAMRSGARADQLEVLARESGFRTIEEDGKRLVREGITTRDEVLRVSRSLRLTKEEREGI
ncbi:MAG: ATPase, T2SS/T4P/T4SS family [Planctomycetota bacterium]